MVEVDTKVVVRERTTRGGNPKISNIKNVRRLIMPKVPQEKGEQLRRGGKKKPWTIAGKRVFNEYESRISEIFDAANKMVLKAPMALNGTFQVNRKLLNHNVSLFQCLLMIPGYGICG
ncbi:hypothetical protein ACSQ67_004871 [Phaseolus vulgaris]